MKKNKRPHRTKKVRKKKLHGAALIRPRNRTQMDVAALEALLNTTSHY